MKEWKTSNQQRCPYCGKPLEEWFTEGDLIGGQRCTKCRWPVGFRDDPERGAIAQRVPYEED